MKEFGKTVCKIAIPVTLQSMLQSSFSIIDQLMIGQLGESSIAAVGLSGNYSLIFSVIMGAVCTVAGIIIAQFVGAKDEKEAWRGFWVSLIFGVLIACVFMSASLLAAETILGLYTKDETTIRVGIPYLKIISFTFVPMSVSAVIAAWLRCNEHASVPLIASLLAVLGNTCFNYLFIFGKFGVAPMGVKGAGYATVISQGLNLCFMLTGFVYCLKKEEKKIYFSFSLQRLSASEYIAMLMPLVISEFLWSLGQNVNSAVFGHIGTDSLAAYMLTSPIQGLFVGALSGLSAAAGVIVGRYLGEKDFDEAYSASKKLMWIGLFVSLILSGVLVLLAKVYVENYQVSYAVKETAARLLIVFAVYAPVKVLNMILGGGIVRSGGDTKIIMLIDIVGTWIVGIPLCFLTAYGLGLSIVAVYAIFSIEEVVRLGMTLIVFYRKKWMHSIAV